jgi:hypothetical protein
MAGPRGAGLSCGMRTRTLMERALPVVGMIVIFGSLLLFWPSLRLQIVGVLAGLLLVEGGTFRMAQRALPSDRRYTRLRAEVDAFIRLVRRLNAAAVARGDDPGAEAEFAAVQQEMEAAIGRMAESAGIDEGVAEGKPRRRTPARR